MRSVVLLLALAPLAYYLLAMYAARRFFRKRNQPAASFTPPASILKPIKGLDDESYENYASFCKQDYPEFEILFNVPDAADPAIPVIKKIISDFPQCSIRLLIGAEHLGACNKVNKLCRLVREARYDVFVISDSDIRVGPDYLRAVVAPFADPKVGAVTCLYRGLTHGPLASELEALGNTSDFHAGVLTARQLGSVDFALGATMATTRERLAQIGGFQALVDHFSDDYELGHRIAGRGYRVELSSYVVSTVYPRQSLRQSFAHQVRWTLTMRVARPWGHFGLVLTHGLPWAILAAAVAPSAAVAAAYIVAYLVLRSAMAWTVGVWSLRDPLLRRRMWMLPLRDAFGFVVWLASFFKRRIEWRGSEFYVRDKRLVPAEPRVARG